MTTLQGQGARKGRSYIGITNQIQVQQYMLTANTISDWVAAYNQANSTFNPNRRKLYGLYERIELDAQIETVTNLRTIAVTNKQINFVEPGKGTNEDYALTQQIRSPWFGKLLTESMSAKWWSHKLIELKTEGGVITDTISIPNQNVVPEKDLVLLQTSNMQNGINYKLPPEGDYCFEVKGAKKLGLYAILAPYVLYKAGSLGDWSQFCELFGLPFREYTYNPFDSDNRKRVEEAAKSMGSAGFAILPEGSTIKIHDTNKTGSKDVFDGLVRTMDEQIAKAVLGGTMITDNGSSQAQATVHYDVKNEINLSDIIWMEYVLNWDVKPRLINFGIPMNGGDLRFNTTREIPLEQRIDMDVKLSYQVPIADEYWYKTYGIPEPTGKQTPINANKEKDGSGGSPDKEKK